MVGGAQQGYHSLLVRDDSGIKDIAGLKGKTLASQPEGSTADTVLKGVVLKQGKLNAEDVNIMGVSPAVDVQSLVGNRVETAFLFEPYNRIAQLVAPVKQIYEVGQSWPFPCMVVITSGRHAGQAQIQCLESAGCLKTGYRSVATATRCGLQADRFVFYCRTHLENSDARRVDA